jgi:hypothetical protein
MCAALLAVGVSINIDRHYDVRKALDFGGG